MIYDQYYPFGAMQLPYAYKALEPDISRFTNFFHYNEHYLPAVKKLNELVKGRAAYQNIPLAELAKNKDKELQRTAGSVFAHELHFRSLADKKSEPSEYMKKRIASDFGSEENLYKAIKDAASELYGPGFVWIAENGAGKLVPLITKEHEIPDFEKYKPVYALDLWEHGYYLDRQNDRDKYIDAALKHINWDEMEKNIKAK